MQELLKGISNLPQPLVFTSRLQSFQFFLKFYPKLCVSGKDVFPADFFQLRHRLQSLIDLLSSDIGTQQQSVSRSGKQFVLHTFFGSNFTIWNLNRCGDRIFRAGRQSLNCCRELTIQIHDACQGHFGSHNFVRRLCCLTDFLASDLDTLRQQIARLRLPCLQVLRRSLCSCRVGGRHGGFLCPRGPIGLTGIDSPGSILRICFRNLQIPLGSFQRFVQRSINTAEPHASFPAASRLRIQFEDFDADVSQQASFKVPALWRCLIPRGHSRSHCNFGGVRGGVRIRLAILLKAVRRKYDRIQRLALAKQNKALQVTSLSHRLGIALFVAKVQTDLEQPSNLFEMILQQCFFGCPFRIVRRACEVIVELLNLRHHAARPLEGCGEVSRFFVFVAEEQLEPTTHGSCCFTERPDRLCDRCRIIDRATKNQLFVFLVQLAVFRKFFLSNCSLPKNSEPGFCRSKLFVFLNPLTGLCDHK